MAQAEANGWKKNNLTGEWMWTRGGDPDMNSYPPTWLGDGNDWSGYLGKNWNTGVDRNQSPGGQGEVVPGQGDYDPSLDPDWEENLDQRWY